MYHVGYDPDWGMIECGRCGHESDALEWTHRPISGDLPLGVFQCPKCGDAFRRCGDVFRREWIEPVQPVL